MFGSNFTLSFGGGGGGGDAGRGGGEGSRGGGAGFSGTGSGSLGSGDGDGVGDGGARGPGEVLVDQLLRRVGEGARRHLLASRTKPLDRKPPLHPEIRDFSSKRS